jgi:hypothetical protein
LKMGTRWSAVQSPPAIETMPCGSTTSTPEVVSICRGRFIGPGDRSDTAGTGLSALAAIPNGYGEGVYDELRHGVTVQKSRDGKRTNLFARALAGRL